jgi:hypothetical protein
VIETERSFFLRYYINGEKHGKPVRVQKCVKLCAKSDQYRFTSDVQPLVQQHLKAVNAGAESFTASMPIGEYIERDYLPWVRANKAVRLPQTDIPESGSTIWNHISARLLLLISSQKKSQKF